MEILHQLELNWILLVQTVFAWATEAMRMVSMLGQEDFFMLIMPMLYWSVDATLGFRLGIMLLVSNEVNSLAKLGFHSPRPYWVDSHIRAFVSESSFGLPSGHAQNAAAIWGLLAVSVRETWVRAVLVALIFLIGFSRVVLGVHFISDVATGWLIGGLLLWLFLLLENRTLGWLRTRTFRQLLVMAVTTTIVMISAVLLSNLALGSWQVLAEWKQNAIAAQPGSEINPLDISHAFTTAGTWFGMLVGAAWLYHLQGGFNANGSSSQRLLRYLIGTAGIFVFWYGLGSIFPRNADLLSYSLRFSRYTLVGLWVTALAPLLFQRMGIATRTENKVAPLSSSQNPL